MNSGEKPVLVPLCPPKIPHGLTRDRTRAFAGGRPAANRLSHGTALLVPYFDARTLHPSVTARVQGEKNQFQKPIFKLCEYYIVTYLQTS
jgi:hypothetical protein